ncbi:MAG: phosphatidylserine decarboxylase [Terracidiphilus sp.]
MQILTIQIIVLILLASAVGLWGRYFPYPSPVVRRWLPARFRWPEQQIRDWLSNRRFQRAFLRYFYRDPERFPPEGTSVIAPADGIVTGTDVRDGTRYLVIALSFWDMHVQRSPASGVVVSVDDSGDTFMDGEGQQFAFLKGKHCPVQKRIVLETGSGRLAVRLITSLAARRIEAWVKPGDEVSRGQRIGRILLGSTVVLELPATAPLLVPTGVRVRAGETPVANAVTAS